jgi:soluble lytic murein transglycosylase-like protein
MFYFARNMAAGAVAAAIFLPANRPKSLAGDQEDGTVAPALYSSQSRELLREAKHLLPENLGRAPAFAKSRRRSRAPASVVSKYVAAETKRRLRHASPRLALETARAIVGEANRRRLDPLFVMAIIQHESSFDPRIRGGHGEIGLMQLKPDTAKWVAERAGIQFKGSSQLLNPITNVRIGVAYLSLLQHSFTSADLAFVSAYNLGPGAVRSKMKIGNKPKIYVAAVLEKYLELRQGLEIAQVLSSRAAGRHRAHARIAQAA